MLYYANNSDVEVQDSMSTEDEMIIKKALEIMRLRNKKGMTISSPEDMQHYLTLEYAERKSEAFGVIWLDNKHRVMQKELLFTGTIDGSAVHAREVVRRALEVNAAACIFFHNHPSGIADPSVSDRTITKQLKTALALFDVRALDHIIVGVDNNYSFAEHGEI